MCVCVRRTEGVKDSRSARVFPFIFLDNAHSVSGGMGGSRGSQKIQRNTIAKRAEEVITAERVKHRRSEDEASSDPRPVEECEVHRSR